ncbi:copper resistance protein CopC [Acinetobacter halotolerans]|uniref:Copper resistance protein C n=2 Tax=Acinetobacter halotolerans TaxID=1752076 RepID=A0A4V2DB53_9GAMM|nr:copper resistance protein CopC [Acinetobacter halotolerans]
MMKKPILGSVFLSLALITGHSFAHTTLLSSTPANNSMIKQAPEKVTLNFGAEVMLMNIKLLDAKGKDIPLNYQVNHDHKKSFDIAVPQLKAGQYTIVWMIMGADGHHMKGDYRFTIQAK